MIPSVFAAFPDSASLWVYPFAQRLDAAATQTVRGALDPFLEQWNSHGAEVRGAYALQDDRFVLLAARPETTVSGCSIDSSVRIFKDLKTYAKLDGLAKSLVYYRGAAGVEAVSRSAFQALIDAGSVGPDTRVFDPGIQSLGELRAGRFELPLREAWHARAFRLQPAAN